VVTGSLQETASLVRERYVAHFQACVAALAGDAHVEPECEALDADGEIVTEGALETPFRHDAALITDSGAETLMFDCAPLAEFRPFVQSVDSLTVHVHPFHWDCCEFTVVPPLQVPKLHPITDWFVAWFRANAEATDGLVSAVHSVTDPEIQAEHTRLVVDFGTAPAGALVALLAALATCGATTVSLGTPEAV